MKNSIGERTTTHGHTKNRKNTLAYNSWLHMKRRCRDVNDNEYKRYGKKGITVCKEWQSFTNFYRDMGERKDVSITLDRIDNNKGYFKENCRWATKAEQSRNKSNNIFYKGECAKDASVRLGGSKEIVSLRLRLGWSKKEAFTRPLKKRLFNTKADK